MKQIIAEVYESSADAILVDKYLGGRRGIWKFLAKTILAEHKDVVLQKCKELDAQIREV